MGNFGSGNEIQQAKEYAHIGLILKDLYVLFKRKCCLLPKCFLLPTYSVEKEVTFANIVTKY